MSLSCISIKHLIQISAYVNQIYCFECRSRDTESQIPLQRILRTETAVVPGKAFVKGLRTCANMDQLWSLLAQYGPYLDVQAITALCSFAVDRACDASEERRAQFPTKEISMLLRTSWLPMFRNNLSYMDSSGLSICMSSVARFTKNQQNMLEAGHKRYHAREHATDRNSSRSISGRLNESWEGIRVLLDEDDLASVMHAVDMRLHSFSSRAAVQLLWGVLVLGCQPPTAWLARYLSCTLPGHALSRCSPRDLSMLLWCLTQLGRRPPPRWSKYLMEAVQLKVHQYDAQELSLILWSLATLRLDPPSSLLEAGVGRAQHLLACMCDEDGWFMEVPSRFCGNRSLQMIVPSRESDRLCRIVRSGSQAHDSNEAACKDRACQNDYNGQHPEQPSNESVESGSRVHMTRPLQDAASCGSGTALKSSCTRMSSTWQQQYVQQGCPGPPCKACPESDALLSSKLLQDASLVPSEKQESWSEVIMGDNVAPRVGSGSSGSTNVLICLSSKNVLNFQSSNPGHDCNSGSHQSAAQPSAPQSDTTPFSTASISQFCTALIRLHFDPGSTFCVVLAAAIAGTAGTAANRSACSVMAAMSPQEMLMMLMGMARWGYEPEVGSPWYNTMLECTWSLVPRMTLPGLSGSLWCLAQMKAKLPAEWMRLYDTRFSLAVRSAVGEGQGLPRTGGREGQGLPRTGGGEVQGLPRTGGGVMQSELPVSVARYLMALGTMGWVPKGALGSLLVGILCQCMSRVPAKHLFPAMLAVARLGLPVTGQQLRVLVLGPIAHGKYDFCDMKNLLQHVQALSRLGVKMSKLAEDYSHKGLLLRALSVKQMQGLRRGNNYDVQTTVNTVTVRGFFFCTRLSHGKYHI
ncbi:hypothetical protein CEUSTIGMA_g7320.t1 [Chlamydomonas eustigma]|uniref:Uncharacterized protein n=1 Tax=Chlamydomonas eustigma TaxID=1157962 RepID=A0A250XAU4_9CHLO|nr:hypothetical protein CEUSTIGMA_g7320.t1 [Chlamydomonas eustigma]|eukprot:GAX79880.1 hypothetical protein CEUSTIGMA_g7320.t1 [Chlamydomonas eustigma]